MNLITSGPSGLVAPFTHASAKAGEIPAIRQYLRIAMRWRYVILGAVTACVLLGLIVTLLMTPQYTATATIEISRESSQVTNFQGVELSLIHI